MSEPVYERLETVSGREELLKRLGRAAARVSERRSEGEETERDGWRAVRGELTHQKASR